MKMPPSSRLLFLLFASLCAASPAVAQMPTLKYDPPAGFFGGQGWMDPQIFVDSMVEGSVEITSFRALQGDFRGTFLRTLFIDRVSPEFRQPQLLGQPAAQPVSIAGGDDALLVDFVALENFSTYFHRRLAIYARGAVAIVDTRARSADRLQFDWQSVSTMLRSMRVSSASVATGGTAAGGGASPLFAAVAGLYVGTRMMWVGNPFGAVGSGTYVLKTYWYLLSRDGRVQRGYQAPNVPDGDITRFDYESARRAAPADGGTYTVVDGHLTFLMGMETIDGDRTPSGDLSIGGSLFVNSTSSNR